MIIVKLIGGLGNQMFQYAAGRAGAVRCGTEPKLDVSGYDNQAKADTQRHYELSIFNIYENMATAQERDRLKAGNGSYLERVCKYRAPFVAKVLFPEKKTYFFENIEQKFEDRILRISGDAYLEGWWQSEKYFADIKETIKSDFTFKKEVQKQYRKYLVEIQKGDVLSLYVRRGDYLTLYKNYFENLSPGYYNKAVSLISKKTKVRKIMVICEDKSWPKKYLRTKIPWFNVFQKDTSKDWQDCLQLMTKCDHHIIHNGSYSWWGAWLSNNPNKVVVGPKKWFKDNKMNSANKIPHSWIRI